jgi:hypothetical protein
MDPSPPLSHPYNNRSLLSHGAAPTLAQIPADVQGEVFRYLPTAQKLSLSFVCKSLHETSQIDVLWDDADYTFAGASLRLLALHRDALRAVRSWQKGRVLASSLLEVDSDDDVFDVRAKILDNLYYGAILSTLDAAPNHTLLGELDERVVAAFFEVAEAEIGVLLQQSLSLAVFKRRDDDPTSIEVTTEDLDMMRHLQSFAAPVLSQHPFDNGPPLDALTTYKSSADFMRFVRGMCRRAGVVRISGAAMELAGAKFLRIVQENIYRLVLGADPCKPDNGERDDASSSEEEDGSGDDEGEEESEFTTFYPCCEECGGQRTFSPSLERVKAFFKGRLYM